MMHVGPCGHCNDGKGKAGGYDPRHAKWHGPFKTLADAEAVSAGIKNVVLGTGAFHQSVMPAAVPVESLPQI